MRPSQRHTATWHQQAYHIDDKGPPFDIQGGAGVFVAGKLFISTWLGGALKISHFITCLYGAVIEVNYLFHAESARNNLFHKNWSPPPHPPWKLNSGPLNMRCHQLCISLQTMIAAACGLQAPMRRPAFVNISLHCEIINTWENEMKWIGL